VLEPLIAAAREALGDDLVSVVLFGSAAEDRLRPTSDVNVIFVLARFESTRIDGLREPLRTAQAAVQLAPMFLLQSEIALASEVFAVKFADVQRRRRVLYGADPFLGMAPSRAAELAGLREVLLNLELRLRQRYALASLRPEQLALVVADAAGPLRAAAAALLELQGVSAQDPKSALLHLVAELKKPSLLRAVEQLSFAREERMLPAGDAAPTLIAVLELAHALRERVEALSTRPQP
jgi:predicted nucleotidyltransferase